MFSRLFLLVACLLASSCQVFAPEDNEAGLLEVHLQSSFDHTPVRITLDTQVIFDSLATTDHRIGLAERVSARTSSGVHTLELLIDGAHKEAQQISLGPVLLYVGVEYNQDGEIVFRFNQSGFVYF
jgi:hypothetical protein